MLPWFKTILRSSRLNAEKCSDFLPMFLDEALKQPTALWCIYQENREPGKDLNFILS